MPATRVDDVHHAERHQPLGNAEQRFCVGFQIDGKRFGRTTHLVLDRERMIVEQTDAPRDDCARRVKTESRFGGR
jgi:hypothetical protein